MKKTLLLSLLIPSLCMSAYVKSYVIKPFKYNNDNKEQTIGVTVSGGVIEYSEQGKKVYYIPEAVIRDAYEELNK